MDCLNTSFLFNYYCVIYVNLDPLTPTHVQNPLNIFIVKSNYKFNVV